MRWRHRKPSGFSYTCFTCDTTITDIEPDLLDTVVEVHQAFCTPPKETHTMSEDQQPQPVTSTPWPESPVDEDTNYNFTVQADDQQVRAMALHEAVTLIASGQVAKAYNVKTSDIALEIAGRFEGYLRGEAVPE